MEIINSGDIKNHEYAENNGFLKINSDYFIVKIINATNIFSFPLLIEKFVKAYIKASGGTLEEAAALPVVAVAPVAAPVAAEETARPPAYSAVPADNYAAAVSPAANYAGTSDNYDVHDAATSGAAANYAVHADGPVDTSAAAAAATSGAAANYAVHADTSGGEVL